ncbi:unnamed protein product [Cylicostephanus goldi]|uniref:Uncharacterized protein n=1 Tax=Cylicostephanus goldi TaxID=71465 RepID=A0A3P6RX05_CYLGO|nr:unnamed protein product [Cylicostephanus goldi]
MELILFLSSSRASVIHWQVAVRVCGIVDAQVPVATRESHEARTETKQDCIGQIVAPTSCSLEMAPIKTELLFNMSGSCLS